MSKTTEVPVPKKKKPKLDLEDVTKEMADKLAPAMEELGGMKAKTPKKPGNAVAKKIEAAKKAKKPVFEDLDEAPAPIKKTPKKDDWTGSGWGKATPGAKLTFADLVVGMVVLEESRQFHSRNVVKIVAPPKDFVTRPDQKYGIFVDPKNAMRLRMQSDQMFCIWDFEFKTENRVFFAVE